MLDNKSENAYSATNTECANQVVLNIFNSCLREMTQAVHTFNFSRAIHDLCML